MLTKIINRPTETKYFFRFISARCKLIVIRQLRHILSIFWQLGVGHADNLSLALSSKTESAARVVVKRPASASEHFSSKVPKAKIPRLENQKPSLSLKRTKTLQWHRLDAWRMLFTNVLNLMKGTAILRIFPVANSIIINIFLSKSKRLRKGVELGYVRTLKSVDICAAHR